MPTYNSLIRLNDRYRHTPTGFEGRAVVMSVTMSEYQRVDLEFMDHNNEPAHIAFDAGELETVENMAPPASGYESEVVLGEQYQDVTGFAGYATVLFFHVDACEQVCLEYWDQEKREMKRHVFDAGRLTHMASEERLTTLRAGGPSDRHSSGLVR